MRPVPPHLHGRPFTTEEALRAGVSPRMLAGQRFVRIHTGVHRTADTPPTLALLLVAARMVLPQDAVVSHLTALRLRGLEIGPLLPLHFSTNRPREMDRKNLVLHRRQDLLRPILLDGFATLDPIRTFVDVATKLDDRRLLWVGDWLAQHSEMSIPRLCEFVRVSHLDGVQRSRRVAPLVRGGVESVQESNVRWHIVRAGLPEPEVNWDIHDDHGAWLARGDLVFRSWKVLVEYDGWHHERDAAQRQRDHLRREALEAAGWRVIVLSAADLRKPHVIIVRIRQALRQRGLAA